MHGSARRWERGEAPCVLGACMIVHVFQPQVYEHVLLYSELYVTRDVIYERAFIYNTSNTRMNSLSLATHVVPNNVTAELSM